MGRGYVTGSVAGGPGWGSREPEPKDVPLSRAGLRAVAKLEALRAGLSLTDLEGGKLRLEAPDGFGDDLSLEEACTVLGMLRGDRCSPHVLKAGGVRIIPAG